ncbi:multiple epidermal growth factor-like domains protein 9 [Thalassophryne amazonica]|uniref:multiple epidermal growth factor-like domains protein 9 n=1 Tax=Thalassophryne amazonica TaxID=390379 RepID=UPI001471062D|nr:multiple epidermal growth factor-like domains protein 9 [Thalassophryne amazonica]
MDCWGVLRVIATVCLLGRVESQTTLPPAVTNTTVSENVTSPTPTPLILSTTIPGCLGLNTSSCEPCAPGSRYDNNTLFCSCCPDLGLCLFPGACPPCSRGFFQPLVGQQQCLPCSPGFYSNLTGSPLCQPCPAGSFSNGSGSESCTRCSPGFFSSEQSSTSCTPCLQGRFCNSSGCSHCQICPGGAESLQDAAKACTLCRPGMHKAPHESKCEICSSGFFQIRWGQESCDICPEDHYCPSPDVNPIPCPIDAFCPEGISAPRYCMETFFRKAGNTCEMAPVTIALLVIAGGVALLFIILMVLRRRRDNDRDLAAAQAPLLPKEQSPRRYYAIPCDAEPVYAGW